MTSGRDRAANIEAAWRRERPDLEPDSVRIVTRIWQLAKVFGEDRRRLLARYDLEPALLDLLGTLRRSGHPYRLTTRELAERGLVTPAAISQRLTRAEERGWVVRTPAAGRSVDVTLTPAGRRRIDEVAGAIFTREAELLATLSARQRLGLETGLRRLVEALAGDGPIGSVGQQSST